MNFANKKIMIVAAHPDDEILGAGATMNRLIYDYNCTVNVLILSKGITSRHQGNDQAQIEKQLSAQMDNILKAQQIIGYQHLKLYDFPDNQFDTIPLLDMVQAIEKEKQAFDPQIVFTHHPGDLNIDHQKTFSATITACRPLPNETVESIISFEVPSATEWGALRQSEYFIPNLYIKVTQNHIDAKVRAMEQYESEKRSFPHPRSPEALQALTTYRGVQSGYELAEAFHIAQIRT